MDLLLRGDGLSLSRLRNDEEPRVPIHRKGGYRDQPGNRTAQDLFGDRIRVLGHEGLRLYPARPDRRTTRDGGPRRERHAARDPGNAGGGPGHGAAERHGTAQRSLSGSAGYFPSRIAGVNVTPISKPSGDRKRL